MAGQNAWSTIMLLLIFKDLEWLALFLRDTHRRMYYA